MSQHSKRLVYTKMRFINFTLSLHVAMEENDWHNTIIITGLVQMNEKLGQCHTVVHC